MSADLEREEDVLRSYKGRFHEDPDSEPTSYAAETVLTAWREVAAHFTRAGIPADPSAFRAWRISLPKGKTVDLTDSKQRSRYKITQADLEADVAPLRCKEVAREIRQSAQHYLGLVYRSVRDKPKGVCLALFIENLPGHVKLAPVNEEEFLREVEEEQ